MAGRAGPRRATGDIATAALACLVAGLGGGRAIAQDLRPADAAAPPGHAVSPVMTALAVPAPAAAPIVLEIGGGWRGPIGKANLALVYDTRGVFSAGLGVAFAPRPSNSLPPLGIFGRARLLRTGPWSFGLVATLSRERDSVDRAYQRPPAGSYGYDFLSWTWDPGFRATGTVAGELDGTTWSLRAEAGVGFLLNDPRCHYDGGVVHVEGSCQSPDIPSAYHFSIEPGRVIPSATVALGYRFGATAREAPGSRAGDAGSEDRSPRSPRTAAILSLATTVAPAIVGALLFESQGHEALGYGVLVTALSLGPAAGHIYAGEYLHAAGLTAARAGAALIGTFVLFDSVIRSGDCMGSQCDSSTSGVTLSLALLAAVPVLAAYDVIDGARAAARANTRHGLAAVAVVPAVAPSGSRGLALAGRF